MYKSSNDVLRLSKLQELGVYDMIMKNMGSIENKLGKFKKISEYSLQYYYTDYVNCTTEWFTIRMPYVSFPRVSDN